MRARQRYERAARGSDQASVQFTRPDATQTGGSSTTMKRSRAGREHMSKIITPSTFARRVGLESENYGFRLKGVLVEQDSEVRVAGVRHELIGDVRNMITGFLKNNRMKLSTGSGDNVGRISARRAWIPLKKRKTELMMHEIAVDSVNVTKPVRFGLPKFDHNKSSGAKDRCLSLEDTHRHRHRQTHTDTQTHTSGNEYTHAHAHTYM